MNMKILVQVLVVKVSLWVSVILHLQGLVSGSPLMFTPQVPVALSQRPDEMQPTNSWMHTSSSYEDTMTEQGIPTVITWSYDGNEVAVEGSWDNWKRRDQEKISSFQKLSLQVFTNIDLLLMVNGGMIPQSTQRFLAIQPFNLLHGNVSFYLLSFQSLKICS